MSKAMCWVNRKDGVHLSLEFYTWELDFTGHRKQTTTATECVLRSNCFKEVKPRWIGGDLGMEKET